MSDIDKFIQPVDGVELVSESGQGTILDAEALQKGRDRIAAGENPKLVADDLAFDEFVLRMSFAGIELSDSAIAQGKQRIAAGEDLQRVAFELGAQELAK